MAKVSCEATSIAILACVANHNDESTFEVPATHAYYYNFTLFLN